MKNWPSHAAPEPSFDLDGYIPFWLTAITNKWTANSSRLYLRKFGIGVMEWRVLGSLATLGTGRSIDICSLLVADSSSVSKATTNLERRGLIEAVKGRFPGRNRPLYLTEAGSAIFEKMKEIALAREDQLLRALDLEDRLQLLILLQKVHERLPELSVEDL